MTPTAGVVPDDARVACCATADVVSNASTAYCREIAGLPPAECATTSGRVVDATLVDAYEASVGPPRPRAAALSWAMRCRCA